MSSSPIRALARALPLLIAFVGLYALSNLTAAGERWEDWLLRAHHYDGALGPLLGREIPFPPFDADAPTLIVGTAIAGLLAAATRRWRVLAVVLVGPSAVLLLTAVFKDVFGRPNLIGATLDTDVSYPSGHAAIALGVAAALLMAVPAGWLRWALPLLAAWSGLAAAALQSVGYHRPSEVLGTGLLTPAVFLVLATIAGIAPSRRAVLLPRPSIWITAILLSIAVIAGAWNDIPWAIVLYAAVAAVSVALTAHTALSLRAPITARSAGRARSDRIADGAAESTLR